jgi:hypothetical protein
LNRIVRLSTGLASCAALAALLTGCGSDSSEEVPPGSASAEKGDCPDKHEITAPNGNDFGGGQVTFDLCKTPKTVDATALKWDEIRSDMGSGTLTLNVNLKTDAGKACYKDASACLPKEGDKLPLVCQTTGVNGDPQRFYAVLMTGKLFNPTVLRNGSTGQEGSKMTAAAHFTNDGDIPVGYVKAESVKAPAGLPECDGALLHSKSTRQIAMMNGDLPREE